MTSVTIYGIKNCDTMKKACQWLSDNGIAFHFHDYKKAGTATLPLALWQQQLGWQTLLNQRGTTWRKLALDMTTLDATQAQQLMQEQPSVIKRPLLVYGSQMLLGFDLAQWQQALPALHQAAQSPATEI